MSVPRNNAVSYRSSVFKVRPGRFPCGLPGFAAGHWRALLPAGGRVRNGWSALHAGKTKPARDGGPVVTVAFGVGRLACVTCYGGLSWNR